MFTRQVQAPFDGSKKTNSLGEFMGIAFDYYDGLEDKLFGKIIENMDLNDTVDTNDFLSKFQKTNDSNHQQVIRQRIF